MNIPKFHETFIPILQVLADGSVLSVSELKEAVQKRFYADLPEELLQQKTNSGDLLILNRIGWGKAYLKQAKMVEQPERGMVRITDKGREALKQGTLSLKQLVSDQDFQAQRHANAEQKTMQGELNDNASPEDLLESGFSELEKQVENELLEKLCSIDPYYFEKVVLQLLHKMGYGEFIETSKSRDGGIDGIINQDQLGLEKIYVQSKRYNENKVRETDIRNFIGAMSDDTSKGIFVTTSSFDEGAMTKAKEARHTIILIDGMKLVSLMNKHGVGVQVKHTYEVKTVDEDFFEQS